jgi:hypothetical protein
MGNEISQDKCDNGSTENPVHWLTCEMPKKTEFSEGAIQSEREQLPKLDVSEHASLPTIRITADQEAAWNILMELVGGAVKADTRPTMNWLLQTIENDRKLVSGVPIHEIPRWIAPWDFTRSNARTLYSRLEERTSDRFKRFQTESSHTAWMWILRALFWLDIRDPINQECNHRLQFDLQMFSRAVCHSSKLAYAMLDLPTVYGVQYQGMGGSEGERSPLVNALARLNHPELTKALLRLADHQTLNSEESLFKHMIRDRAKLTECTPDVLDVLNEATSDRVARTDGSGLCLHHVTSAVQEIRIYAKAQTHTDAELSAAVIWNAIPQKITLAREHVRASTSHASAALQSLFNTGLTTDQDREWILPLPATVCNLVVTYAIHIEYVNNDHLSCCRMFGVHKDSRRALLARKDRWSLPQKQL